MLENRELGEVGKIIVSKNLKNIIDTLHSEVGGTEWSGVLFYKPVSGNLQEMKDLVFIADYLYPMNIGSHAYTEFEYSGKIMEAYDIFSDAIEYNSGMIHTHHNMNAFFSGTDSDELYNNCKLFNYYISLIVNFSKDYKCKIAFPSNSVTNIQSTIKGSDGKPILLNLKKEEQIILVGDLKVELEGVLERQVWLIERISELKKEKQSIPVYQNNYTPRYFPMQERVFNEDFDYSYKKKDITIEDFLITLISVGTNSKFYTVRSALNGRNSEIEKLNNDIEYDEYEALVELNVDIVHDNVYHKDDININKHLLEAAMFLEEMDAEFENNKVYDIIKSSLLYGIQ